MPAEKRCFLCTLDKCEVVLLPRHRAHVLALNTAHSCVSTRQMSWLSTRHMSCVSTIRYAICRFLSETGQFVSFYKRQGNLYLSKRQGNLYLSIRDRPICIFLREWLGTRLWERAVPVRFRPGALCLNPSHFFASKSNFLGVG